MSFGGDLTRKTRTFAVPVVAALLATASACSSSDDATRVRAEAAETSTTLDGARAERAEPGDLVDVYVDPHDGTHLILRLAFCYDDASASAVETDAMVMVSVASRPLEPPCDPDLVDLRLESPLGTRRVIDAAHDLEVQVQPADFLEPDTATLVTAECTPDAAHEAVARDVDGGLRTTILACDQEWMAVDTYTDACPATGESIADGCVANRHTAYFHNDAGYWDLVSFDCEVVRRDHPELPDEICQE